MEAELIAINGVYKVADDMDPALRGKAVHAWLDGDSVCHACPHLQAGSAMA